MGGGAGPRRKGINYFSVKMSGAIQVLLTSLKIGTIVVIAFGVGRNEIVRLVLAE